MEASQTLVRNMETKREIREKLLQIRRNLPSPKWAEMSDEITAKISCHPWFQKADTIYGYLSYNQEVDTWSLLAFALQEGKKAVSYTHLDVYKRQELTRQNLRRELFQDVGIFMGKILSKKAGPKV